MEVHNPPFLNNATDSLAPINLLVIFHTLIVRYVPLYLFIHSILFNYQIIHIQSYIVFIAVTYAFCLLYKRVSGRPVNYSVLPNSLSSPSQSSVMYYVCMHCYRPYQIVCIPWTLMKADEHKKTRMNRALDSQ